jgi:membrane protein DedA with SNARE-associated domain
MLESLLARFGYWAVLIGSFFEGEAILIAGGALAHRGLLLLPWVMLAAFVGSVAGDQLWFQLGRRYGRPFLERRPAWQARVSTIQGWLDRYGNAFVFGFRFIYGIRSVTPAVLGASGYPHKRFVCLNLAGGAVWAVLVGAGGWALGAALTRLLERAAHAEELLGVGCAVVLAGWLAWRALRPRTIE